MGHTGALVHTQSMSGEDEGRCGLALEEVTPVKSCAHQKMVASKQHTSLPLVPRTAPELRSTPFQQAFRAQRAVEPCFLATGQRPKLARGVGASVRLIRRKPRTQIKSQKVASSWWRVFERQAPLPPPPRTPPKHPRILHHLQSSAVCALPCHHPPHFFCIYTPLFAHTAPSRFEL